MCGTSVMQIWSRPVTNRWRCMCSDATPTFPRPSSILVLRTKSSCCIYWSSQGHVWLCVYSPTFALIRKLISIYGFIYHIGTNDAQQATSAEEDAEHLIHPWVPAPWKVYHGMQLIYLSWFKYSSEGGAVVTDSFPRFLSFHQMKWWTKQRVIIQKTKNIQATILEQLFVYTEKNRRPLFLSLFNRGN